MMASRREDSARSRSQRASHPDVIITMLAHLRCVTFETFVILYVTCYLHRISTIIIAFSLRVKLATHTKQCNSMNRDLALAIAIKRNYYSLAS